MFIPTNDYCKKESRTDWLGMLPAGQFRMLFEQISGTLFFAKNRELKLMMGDSAFVARCGKATEEEILGMDDYALFPPRLAEHFRSDDRKVISTGKPLVGFYDHSDLSRHFKRGMGIPPSLFRLE